MRKSITIASSAALALLGLSLGLFTGGDLGVTGSYQGGYYASVGSYAPGAGGDAGFDTLTVLFAIDPLYDGRVHTEWAADSLAADLIVDLSDLGNEFAYCVIDSTAPSASFRDLDTSGSFYRLTMKPAASGDDRWLMASANRRHELIYIPFEDFLPANCQIISAVEKRISADIFNMSFADTICATLLTSSGDSLWHTHIGVTSPAQPHVAHATWQYQIAGLNKEGYPAANGGAWETANSGKGHFWDFGSVSDWSGTDTTSTVTTYDEVDISLLNCVQAIVNGEVNHGILKSYTQFGAATPGQSFFNWDGLSPGVEERPHIVVKYLTRNYTAPFPGGAEWAFSLQTDDGINSVNTIFADSMAARDGGKFTMFFTEPAADSGAVHITWSDVMSWYDSGIVEVGSHSVWHTPTLGLNAWDAQRGDIGEYVRGMYPLTLTGAATGWDSLLYDTDPEWMFYQAEAGGYGDLRGSAYFGTAFGIPVTSYSPDIQMAFSYHEYAGARVLGVVKSRVNSDGNSDPNTQALRRRASADSTYAGFRSHNNRAPRNIRIMALSHGVNEFVGGIGDDPSMAVVTYNTKNLVYNAIAQQRRVISFLVHDVKTGEIGSYPTGLDADELGAILDVVDELGGRYMFWSELTNWFALYSATIATPPSYGQPAAYQYTIPEDYWGQLDGVDNIFIPGVK